MDHIHFGLNDDGLGSEQLVHRAMAAAFNPIFNGQALLCCDVTAHVQLQPKDEIRGRFRIPPNIVSIGGQSVAVRCGNRDQFERNLVVTCWHYELIVPDFAMRSLEGLVAPMRHSYKYPFFYLVHDSHSDAPPQVLVCVSFATAETPLHVYPNLQIAAEYRPAPPWDRLQQQVGMTQPGLSA